MDRRGYMGTASKFAGVGLLTGYLGFLYGENRAREEVRRVRDEYSDRLARERAANTFGDKVTEGSQDLTLGPGEHQFYHLEGADEEPRQLRYVVISDVPIDVLVMSRSEYDKYANDDGGSIATFGSARGTTHGTGMLEFSDPLSLVIDNTEKGDAVPPPNPIDVGVAYEVYE